MKRALTTLGLAACTLLAFAPAAQAGPQPLNYGTFSSAKQCQYAQSDLVKTGKYTITVACRYYSNLGGWQFSALPK